MSEDYKIYVDGGRPATLNNGAMTPKDCRAMADQYSERAHNAKTSSERRVYLKLARAWLEAALAEGDAAPLLCRPLRVFS
jgi:hypothetical protein